jgi:hypothetical protein
VQPNTYLNEISLADWRELFVREWPEATLRGEADMYLPGELERLRTPGELSGYADEELLTRSLIALWKKPPSADRTPR